MGSEQPHWRGINHLALITTDMGATVASTTRSSAPDSSRRSAPLPSGTTSSSSVPSRPSPSSSTRAPSSSRSRARRHPRPEGGPVRPPLVQPPGRGGARVAAPPVEGARLRGHRRRRPRGHALDLLHRPQRHRARGVVVGHRRDRSATPTTATGTSSPMPTRSPRSVSSRERAAELRRPPASWATTRRPTQRRRRCAGASRSNSRPEPDRPKADLRQQVEITLSGRRRRRGSGR